MNNINPYVIFNNMMPQVEGLCYIAELSALLLTFIVAFVFIIEFYEAQNETKEITTKIDNTQYLNKQLNEYLLCARSSAKKEDGCTPHKPVINGLELEFKRII